MELYKKHRPKKLKRVVGNEETVKALSNMLRNKTLPHTILFHGASGCGKTTLARILKNELNCSELDFKELNCSDFRGIDTIREIARTMNMSSTGGTVRIWLLDEVHQLSKDGQNAALKILEDTPKHVYFLLCTTDPNKLLKTIRTRCCEMPVFPLEEDDIKLLVSRVAKKEGIEVPDRVLYKIIEGAQGSPRTALVLLDKVKNLDKEEMLKGIEKTILEENETIELCRLLASTKSKWSDVTKVLNGLSKVEPETIRWAVLGYMKSILLKTPAPRAAMVIQEFQDNFYDSKHAGLVLACYNVLHD